MDGINKGKGSQLAQGIIVPIEAGYALSPEVFYGFPETGIYLEVGGGEFCRITFENLDSLKVSRGESLPYPDDWEEGKPFCWVFKVKNSEWLRERYEYEKETYGSDYEFGGNVDEMLTDFNHLLFRFQDEFVEAIARGFWLEESTESLFGKGLSPGHPFLRLPASNSFKIEAHHLTCYARTNPVPLEELKNNVVFCSQKLMEFAWELDGAASVTHSLVLSLRNGKLTTTFRGHFGKQIKEIEGLGTLDGVREELEEYMREVYERRKGMGK